MGVSVGPAALGWAELSHPCSSGKRPIKLSAAGGEPNHSRLVPQRTATSLNAVLFSTKIHQWWGTWEWVANHLPGPRDELPKGQEALDLPTGTVTFLFTDIEGSTELWERDEALARQVLVRHSSS